MYPPPPSQLMIQMCSKFLYYIHQPCIMKLENPATAAMMMEGELLCRQVQPCWATQGLPARARWYFLFTCHIHVVQIMRDWYMPCLIHNLIQRSSWKIPEMYKSFQETLSSWCFPRCKNQIVDILKVHGLLVRGFNSHKRITRNVYKRHYACWEAPYSNPRHCEKMASFRIYCRSTFTP